MKWIYNLSNEHLMILFNSNKLLLWDSNKSQKLWSKTLTDSVYQFSIDPHLNGRIACKIPSSLTFSRKLCYLIEWSFA